MLEKRESYAKLVINLIIENNKMVIKGKRTKKNIVYKKVYSVWKNMYDRCYKETCVYYKNYGLKGVTICERWHSLDNFIEDIDKIDGFDFELFINGCLSLDKDSKIRNNTIYSLENCKFISKEENNKFKPHQQKDAIGISPNGIKYEFFNQSEFAREHGLKQSTINDCLNGRCKTHKKWKFYYKQD